MKNESKKMALAKCSECGVNIIREAKFCPKCGAPAPEPSTDEGPVSAHPEHKNEKQSPSPPKRAVAVPPPRMARPVPPKLPPKVEKTIGAENRSSTSKAFWLLLAVIVSIALAVGAFWQRDFIFGATDPEILETSIVEQSNSISSPPETQTEVPSQLPTAAENSPEQAVFPEQPAYDRSIDSVPVQPQQGYSRPNVQQPRSNGDYSRQREPDMAGRSSSQSNQSIINIYNKFLADTAEGNKAIGRSISKLKACGVNAKGDYTYNLKIMGDYYLVYSGPFNDPMDALRERQLASSCGISSDPESLR